MRKLTYVILLAFLAGLAASAWTASAAETSGKHQIRAGHKAGVRQGKPKKGGKHHQRQHQKRHAKQANA